MKIECSSKVMATPHTLNPVSFEDVTHWVKDLEQRSNGNDITLTAIMGSKGPQHDPVSFLRGLKATWEEDA